MATQESTSLLGISSRIFWMVFGPMLMVVMAYMVIRTGNGWLTGADIGYLGVLVALMLARWLEFRGGNPLTAEGEPATPAHLRRYLVWVAVLGLAVWVIANVLGNYVLAS